MKQEKIVPNQFNLGQQITVNNILKRRTKYITPDEYGISKRFKVWEPLILEHSKVAVIIGIRNLSNGYTDFDNEAGNIYTPTEYFKALLVVSDLHSTPYFILIESLK